MSLVSSAFVGFDDSILIKGTISFWSRRCCARSIFSPLLLVLLYPSVLIVSNLATNLQKKSHSRLSLNFELLSSFICLPGSSPGLSVFQHELPSSSFSTYQRSISGSGRTSEDPTGPQFPEQGASEQLLSIENQKVSQSYLMTEAFYCARAEK